MKFYQKGAVFYVIENMKVTRYTYLCPHPNPQYHVLLNMNQEPIRVHKERMDKIASYDFTSWDEAKAHLADWMEECANDLRAELKTAGYEHR